MTRVFALIAVLLVATACGGGSGRDPLEDDLPGLVPALDDVIQHFPERWGEPTSVDREFWPNVDVSKWDQQSIHDGASTQELENRGRVTGYRAEYVLGEQDTFRATTFGVTVRVDLFDDDESAAADVDRLPNRSYVSDAEAAVGEQSLSWGYGLWTSPDGIEPQCPCEFRFRVGRLVGYVNAWYSYPVIAPPPFMRDLPPPYLVDFDPAELTLASQMAERMREALESS